MSALCTIGGCERPVEARGWCEMHYARWRLHGDTDKAKCGRKPGIPQSIAERQKRSESMKRAYAEGRHLRRTQPISESHKAALLKAITGRPSTTKGKTIPQEKRAWSKGGRQSPEAISKIAEASKAHWQDPEYRATQIEERKRRWEDPDFRARGLAYLGDIRGPTTIEVAVAQVLTALGIEFKQQKVIGGFICDIFVPHLQLDIECDGLYWHSLPEMKNRDRYRDVWLKRNGYHILRLGEAAIRADARAAVVEGLARVALI